MLAVELQQFGGLEGLQAVERPDPVPGTGQVRVDLVAAALNRRDYWIRVGGKVVLPAVLGSDGAGVVSAVGAGVTDVRVGDEVVINPSLDWGDSEEAAGPGFRILGVPDQGTYAERIVVAAEQLRPRPQRLSWLESAALPLAGLTAWRVLVTHAEAGPGKTILVPGAGGGVATFLIQIASALGARVLVTAGSEEKLDRARQLGAEGGALYTDDDWPEQVAPVDAIADSVGAPVWEGAFRALRPGGRLINFGDTARATAEIELSALYFGYFRIQGTTMGSPREFEALLEHVETAAWRPVVDSVFPLRDAAAAHARLEQPDRFGKVVLQVRGV
ncbi:MAG TPA: zinc-binding dehydrogenase [Gaiellaceae bacterium]|nr:zinc-binding dehydrogenase [Gaiellaceae bacterium]